MDDFKRTLSVHSLQKTNPPGNKNKVTREKLLDALYLKRNIH